ncbi:hypothetical protein PCANB_002217 [Pneumocystis canis]|nr:hypothetical protein PCK1_002384 [Pneumocystis canis]KAG5438887.1 hypothetical protein PCANB_002217 [Pneumocystis canis]
MQKKRKFQGVNSSKIITSGPIDIESNQRGAFPEVIELDSSSEDDYILPFDGISYLKQVRAEAKHRPGFKVAQIPLIISTKEKNTTILSEIKKIREEDNVTENAVKYSFLWQEKFLKTFTLLRKSFSLQNISISSSLPKDKTEWHKFIFKMLNPPTVSLLFNIDQYTTLNLLKWNTEWLSYNSPREQMMWIFFLLVKIDIVMTSDELSILRELGKKCLILRNETSLPLHVQSNIDMVISIVGNLFGQKDLLLK